VDTHKHIHVAAVLDTIGGIIATLTIPTDTGGYGSFVTGRTVSGRSSRSALRAPAPMALG
jgi:hypothetical protein